MSTFGTGIIMVSAASGSVSASGPSTYTVPAGNFLVVGSYRVKSVAANTSTITIGSFTLTNSGGTDTSEVCSSYVGPGQSVTVQAGGGGSLTSWVGVLFKNT